MFWCGVDSGRPAVVFHNDRVDKKKCAIGPLENKVPR